MLTKAIVRKPGKNFSEGITTSGLGKPDYDKVLEQHNNYCRALEKCGLNLIILEPDIKFPDCTFVEDTAIMTEEFAVITRPGDSRRLGEEEEIKEVLQILKKIEIIRPPGNVDGGDVLRAKDHFYIGLSKRTNQNGANQLQDILFKYGYSSSLIAVGSILHLKSGVNYINNNNLIIIPELSGRKEFSDYKHILVNPGEEYSANCLPVNNFLLFPEGFPATRKILTAKDYTIMEIDISEFRKMDGGLTCLSLRF